MDNFFTWFFLIIWFIFFIAQILGKAKKNIPQQNKDQNNRDDFSFDTIFGEQKPQAKNEKEYDRQKTIRDIFSEFDLEDKYSEHTKVEPINYDNYIPINKKSIETLKQERKSELNELFTEKKINNNLQLTAIKEKLKKPNSFKEAIILAEILGKPKALRGRWQRNLF